ncbi:MAG: apolipoprotein N-acyltransferase [Gammaproteobacteria bacterium]|nr:apolipoprotein N-acyltransferase [Gammaproteobacteria bacterium]
MASKDQHFLMLFAADWPNSSRLLAFVLGCATTLVFAPAEWSLLAPLLMLPLLFITLTVSPKDAAWHFFWFGFGLFLTGTYWIYISVHVFGNAALWIALLLMIGLSLIMAGFLWLAGWLTARLCSGEPWHLFFVGPAAWVLIEWLRGWVLSGFPWLAHGYGQVESVLGGWAPVLGVYGVSVMLMFSSAAILVAIMVPGRDRVIALPLVLLPWIAGAVLGFVDWTEPYGKAVRTTIVQAGVSQDRKWLPEQRKATLDFYRGATLSVPDSELVVWPEVAIPARNDQVQSYLNIVERDARRNGQTVLFGILELSYDRGAEGQLFNSVITLGTDERMAYRKRHLVPFGEYFPVPAGVREWMKLQNLPHADLAAGDDVQPLLRTVNDIQLAVAICYEDAYGAEQLYAFPEADILINVSNDAWFGDSIAPHQHLQIAQMRALETGRYAVRSTNTGISAFIAPDGTLLRTGRQFDSDVMTTDIFKHRGATPYSGVGNWPVIALCILILGFFRIRSGTSL